MLSHANISGIGGITPHTPVAGNDANSSAGTWVQGPLADISYKAITQTGAGRVRRLDNYSKLGLAAMALCLRDAGLLDRHPAPAANTPDGPAPPVTGVTVTSRYGCLATDIDYYRVLKGNNPTAAPNLFAYTLPSSFLGEAAIIFGLNGPALALTPSFNRGLAVIATALDLMQAGQCDAVLCGWCDLEAPGPFSDHPSGPSPGAVFFYLVQACRNSSLTYGELTQAASHNTIRCNGHRVGDRDALLQACGPRPQRPQWP